jgi:2-amino-4-hydroxy-6-hydroxymethyldihydropteridine diphosphokinase
MSTCLIALGSNLGDRAATLDAAIADISSLGGVTLNCHSRWHATKPVGCGDNLHGFLNGAALCETSLSPAELLAALHGIEARHGRRRTQRWADRTLDLDVLLYDDDVVDAPALTIPHPRMSFRRFVLEPAVEIAGQLVHPTIGWTLDQLLRHLDAGADCLAVVSPDVTRRAQLAKILVGEFPDSIDVSQPDVGTTQLWPANLTTRLSMHLGESVTHATIAAAKHPKLTILLDPEITIARADDEILNWTAICRQKGCGPTLRIRSANWEAVSTEAFAAVQAVWSALGPRCGDRLE